MKEEFDEHELAHIATTTLNYYDQTADFFWENSRNHDISQNYHAFLHSIHTHPPFKLLDLGCGPGRDLRYFSDQGHQAIGLEGSEKFCQMARDHAQCEVWQQNLLKMDLPWGSFDGIFANAVLFHIPKPELPRVLRELNDCLRSGGILFTSNPRKKDVVWYGEQPGSYLELDEFDDLLQQAGFKILHHYFRPSDKPLHEQNWVAIVSRKIAGMS